MIIMHWTHGNSRARIADALDRCEVASVAPKYRRATPSKVIGEVAPMPTNASIRDQVRDAYSAAARDPASKQPFPVGRAFAQSLGYSAKLLDSIPAAAVEGFAGVSNVSCFADILTGATVLDVGCGAGLDTIIAAQRVGSEGRVLGIDFSASMLDRARQALIEAGLTNVELRHCEAERLPLADGTVDVALVNGIFNLNPHRQAIFHELARVLRSGGSAYCAELILIEPLQAADQACPANWFA